MKLSHLFESQSYEGYYSTFAVATAVTNGRERARQALADNPNSGVVLDEDQCLVSGDFDKLSSFVHSHFPEIDDKIFYSSGKNPVHSVTRFPPIIKGHLLLNYNCEFTSLKDIHKHIKEIHGKIYCDCRKITSNILGVVLIKGLKGFSTGAGYRKSRPNGWELETIIEKYIPANETYEGGDPMECQDELIDAGFEKYAQL